MSWWYSRNKFWPNSQLTAIREKSKVATSPTDYRYVLYFDPTITVDAATFINNIVSLTCLGWGITLSFNVWKIKRLIFLENHISSYCNSFSAYFRTHCYTKENGIKKRMHIDNWIISSYSSIMSLFSIISCQIIRERRKWYVLNKLFLEFQSLPWTRLTGLLFGKYNIIGLSFDNKVKNKSRKRVICLVCVRVYVCMCVCVCLFVRMYMFMCVECV